MMSLQMLLNLLNWCDFGILLIFYILFETNVHLTLLIFSEGGITSSSDSVSDDDENDGNDDVSSSESPFKESKCFFRCVKLWTVLNW